MFQGKHHVQEFRSCQSIDSVRVRVWLETFAEIAVLASRPSFPQLGLDRPYLCRGTSDK